MCLSGAAALAVWAAVCIVSASTPGRNDELQYAVRFLGADHAVKARRAADDLGFRPDPARRRRRRMANGTGISSDVVAEDDDTMWEEHPSKHPDVHESWPLTPKIRLRRYHPSDPLFNEQWYLVPENHAAMGLWQGPAWDRGINGTGVVITIVDDGLETNHPDLARNYDPSASHNFNARKSSDPYYGQDDNPYPDRSDPINKHGTRCAGAAAAGANNDVCGVGVAFDARVGGIRMLDGPVDDAVEAGSLSWNNQHVDIYSCSWGPDDDGKTYDGPGGLTRRVFRSGALFGRHGLGSLFVWAAGNGGSGDQCNCDGYVTSVYTIAINAVNADGSKPGYTEQCASVFVTTDTGSVTTDIFAGCTQTFSGTSAAAPVAAGAFALLLQANPCLGWRDVQHIAALAAAPHGSDAVSNSVGLRHSVTFGFGILNVTRMTELATGWTPVGAAVRLSITSTAAPPPSGSEIVVSIHVTGCDDHGGNVCIARLEHVQLTLSLKSSRARGQLSVVLTAPTGTVSRLLWPRFADTVEDVSLDWTFLSVVHWGEAPAGTWVARIRSEDGGEVCISSWELILHGTADYSGASVNASWIPSTRPNHTLPNGCVVCGINFFNDGLGGCRPCHPSCSTGCSASGEQFCIDEESEDGVAGTGFGHTEIGSWFFRSSTHTVDMVVLGVLGVLFVVVAVQGARRVWAYYGPSYTSGPSVAGSDGGDGTVALLSPEGADLADHETIELESLKQDATARAAAAYITVDGVAGPSEVSRVDDKGNRINAWGSPLSSSPSPLPAIATTAM